MNEPLQPKDIQPKSEGISRREMVQKLVGGASSGLIASSVTVGRPAEGQSVNPAPDKQEDGKLGERTPAFLDSHQLETLGVLAEIIIPGSTKAEVARFVDLLLSVETMENREKFVTSLSAMDGEALFRYGQPFKSLNHDRQIDLLTLASNAASGHSPGPNSRPSGASAPEPMPPGSLRDHFDNLKGWVSKAYYSSEIGLRELGWSDSYFYDSLPECNGTTS
jgi:hypothetical protein